MTWIFYIIKNKKATYAGVSPDPVRRLRQHNGEIVGGAKYTRSRGNGWKHICLVMGFQNKIQTLQFEWAVKHASNKESGCKSGGGIKNRLKKLIYIMNKEQWTKKSPLSITVPLTIEWKENIDIGNYFLPEHIVEHKKNTEQNEHKE